MTILSRNILRLLDANLNRAVEGIRILEETSRMIFNNSEITGEIKDLRHSLVAVAKQEKILDNSLLLSRDSEHDILRDNETSSENNRTDLHSIIRANAGRAQEAVRALEEYVKLLYPNLSIHYKFIRFRLYDIEKSLAVLLQQKILTSRERLGVYVILDHERFLNKNISDLIEVLINAGAGTVVFRDGISCDHDFLKNSEIVISACRKNLVSGMINDRLDIALLVEAEGILVGPSDVPADLCKKVSNPGFITGFSLFHCTDIDIERIEGADYYLSSPVSGDSQSIAGLSKLISESSAPVVALCEYPEEIGKILEIGAAGIGIMPEYTGGFHEIEKIIVALKRRVIESGNQ
jgi:thiamine-phosphate pyrophosphorylase